MFVDVTGVSEKSILRSLLTMKMRIENNREKKNDERKISLRGELLTTILSKVALASINLKFNLLAVATSGLDDDEDTSCSQL